MDLINIGNDPWLTEYNACEKLSRDIMEQIHLRNTHSSNDALSGKIRIRLKQFGQEVKLLDDKLSQASVVATLTLRSSGERERRKRQIDNLQSRVHQLEEEFSRKPKYFNNRGVVDLGTTGWGGDDDDEILPVSDEPTASISDLKTRQQNLMEKQEQGLEELSKIISRQKDIASAIGNEVDEQNEILDDIGNNMDRVDSRIHRETDMIKVIGKKDSTWVYWIIIIVLFVAILCTAFI